MEVLRIWFDPVTGRASESEHRGWWRVSREDLGVSILTESGALVGSGRWSGKGISQRYSIDADHPITSRQWGKLERAFRNAEAGTLGGGPNRVVMPQVTRPAGQLIQGLVDLRTGVIRSGTEPSDEEVGISIEGGRVTIHDGLSTATAHWDGHFLGKREPNHTVLHSNTAGWNAVEQAVRSLTGGPATSAPSATPEPARGFIEATVQSMTGEILERRETPSSAPVTELFHCRITVDGERVTIVDHVGTATARLDGEALVDRDANDSMLSTTAERWTVLERAAVELAAERRAGVRQAPELEPATEADDEAAEDDPKPRRELRSGWWALGATVLAIGGTIVAWSSVTPGDTVGIVIVFVLGALALGLLIYTLYGVTTRCPSCKAWYRRKTTSVENLGTTTETRQESKPVYDSSGKQTGTTYETVTYNRTTYRYHYQCKECAHRWTGTGSSESRA